MDTYQQMDLFHDNDDLPAFQQTVPLYVKSLTTLLSVWRTKHFCGQCNGIRNSLLKQMPTAK